LWIHAPTYVLISIVAISWVSADMFRNITHTVEASSEKYKQVDHNLIGHEIGITQSCNSFESLFTVERLFADSRDFLKVQFIHVFYRTSNWNRVILGVTMQNDDTSDFLLDTEIWSFRSSMSYMRCAKPLSARYL
jgi:hypothetical protein